MDASTASDGTEKPWDHPWTTNEMRKNRADWNLAGDSGLLQHLHQFSDDLMQTANKTQEALDSLSSELDETIIFIDNITNTSLAVANTQFIESRVCEDDIETKPQKEEQLEIPKTKEQSDAELIASIGESVRQGIAIMDEKYKTVEVVASDSEDDGDIPIPSVILRPIDPYEDRLLPYVIGSEKWNTSSKIGLESSSSSESELQEKDDSANDYGYDVTPVSKPNNLHNSRISRSSLSPSESHDMANDIAEPSEDGALHQNQDIFDSENDNIVATNSSPNNSSSAAPNFAEELAKRLGSVFPKEKSLNTQIITEPIVNQPKDDLFTPEDEDLFGTPSKNLFDEQPGLFNDLSPNSLWHDKPAKLSKPSVIPPSFDVPPPINDVSSKSKSAIDDLFGDADSEDSDDIFSGKTSIGKPLNKKKSSTNNLRCKDNERTKKLLSVGGEIEKEGMATSTPETNDVASSLFDDDSEDISDLFGVNKKTKRNDWSEAKASVPDKTAGSTPAEASDTSQRKKPVGGVSILGNIDIFSSGKLRRQVSSDSSSSNSSSKSSADFDTSQSRTNNTRDVTVPPLSENSPNRSSVMAAPGNTESQESSGVFLQPPSIDDVTTGSNISPNFQPQMTSTWNKTGDMYRESIVSDSLFAAKTLGHHGNDSDSLNNARIDEPAEIKKEETFNDNDDLFGPPPLPKMGSKTGVKSKRPSLFDDSDSGDDLFSRTSSGSRSQKSGEFLSTIATSFVQSSDKSRIIRSRGLFDDEDEEEEEIEEKEKENDKREEKSDIFGSKESAAASDLNLFGKRETRRIETASSEENKTSSVLSKDDTKEEKNTTKFSQTLSTATKLESIFDDLEDDDLFGQSLNKKSSAIVGENNRAPSLFDDSSDDLFALPGKKIGVKEMQKSDKTSPKLKRAQDSTETITKSVTKVGDKVKTKVMEQLAAKLEVSSKSESGKSEKAAKEIEEEKIGVDRKYDGDDIFAKDKPKDLAAKILDGLKAAQKSKAAESLIPSKPGIAKKPEALKKLEIVSNKSLNVRKEVETSSSNAGEKSSVSFEEKSTIKSLESCSSVDKERIESVTTLREATSRSEEKKESRIGDKREPPKTLEINSSSVTAATSSSEKSSVVQRRVVSGKIKNLMGRMNDLKILSPTDSPPVWRKNDERVSEDGDKDSEDGGSFSVEANKESPASPSEKPAAKPVTPPIAPPPLPEEKDLEPAISFDEPVQVQTLSVTASKSRVRIQTKRRPQSRRARQIALRKSGIDFDTVDAVDSLDENNFESAESLTSSNTERLIVSNAGSETLSVKVTETNSSTHVDDRSELSFSKESTVSVNKNTLLSPSTDEEDLFDVPPDLPEDPPREDSLFGRAPILSPVESFIGVSSKDVKQESRRSEKRSSAGREEISASSTETIISTKEESISEVKRSVVDKRTEEKKEEKLIDPLRDESHDPLKDPSILFPFVTKTPSPEKGKNLLFNDDDDSLFTSKIKDGKKTGDRLASGEKKQSLDLFADDSETDLFATSLSKSTRKSNREKNIDLFADDDNQDDDELFGGGGNVRKKSTTGGVNLTSDAKSFAVKESLFAAVEREENLFGSPRTLSEKKKAPPASSSRLFSDDESSEIFTAGTAKNSELATNSGAKKTVDNIFGDQSSGDEDLFVGRKSAVVKKQTLSSTGLFDDDAGDLFGGSKSSLVVKSKSTESRKVVKKTATRDLRKTAEKILEDPLSMLQDD